MQTKSPARMVWPCSGVSFVMQRRKRWPEVLKRSDSSMASGISAGLAASSRRASG